MNAGFRARATAADCFSALGFCFFSPLISRVAFNFISSVLPGSIVGFLSEICTRATRQISPSLQLHCYIFSAILLAPAQSVFISLQLLLRDSHRFSSSAAEQEPTSWTLPLLMLPRMLQQPFLSSSLSLSLSLSLLFLRLLLALYRRIVVVAGPLLFSLSPRWQRGGPLCQFYPSLPRRREEKASGYGNRKCARTRSLLSVRSYTLVLCFCSRLRGIGNAYFMIVQCLVFSFSLFRLLSREGEEDSRAVQQFGKIFQ